jgi:uncharacterized protein YeaO (DUF488 family)
VTRDLLEAEAVTIRIVRLGSERAPGEGLRIGTVRRPPRGVPKADFARRNFYDVWLPNLAPSEGLLHSAQAAASSGDARAWRQFVRRYRMEMKSPDNRALLDTLAALSHHTDFAVGCYCADEALCHRSVLRQLLAERGATMEA